MKVKNLLLMLFFGIIFSVPFVFATVGDNSGVMDTHDFNENSMDKVEFADF